MAVSTTVVVSIFVIVYSLEVANATGKKRPFFTGGSSNPRRFSKQARLNAASMIDEGISIHTVAAGQNIEEFLAAAMLNELKKGKTSVDALNEDGDTPLVLAAKLCRKDMYGTVHDSVVPEREPLIADVLLNHGANPNQVSSSRSSEVSILSLAISNGCVKLVRKLLERRDLKLDDQNLFDSSDRDCSTRFFSPLHLALYKFLSSASSRTPLNRDFESIVHVLIDDYRVSVNPKAASPSVLLNAIHHAPADIVRKLLCRPDLDVLVSLELFGSEKQTLTSPFQLSLEMNRLDVASAILTTLSARNQLSLAIDQVIALSGVSPISILAKNCGISPKESAELAHMLLPMVDVNAVDHSMQTPLDFAVTNGCRNFVELLLATKDIRMIGRDAIGATPILETAISTLRPDMLLEESRVSIALSLIQDSRVDVNSISNAASYPPLHLAVKQAPLPVVQALLNRADLLAVATPSFLSIGPPTGDLGQTALHTAALLNRDELIGDLLRHIPVDILNGAGRTTLCEVALHCNSIVRIHRVITPLLNAGADPMSVCSFERGEFPVLQTLVDRRCSIALNNILVFDVNARVQLQSPPTSNVHALHLASGFSTDNARKLDYQNNFLVLNLLLEEESTDVNARTSDGVSPVQLWCESDRYADVILADEQRASVRHNVLRYFSLDNRQYWVFQLAQDIQFGSEQFSQFYLKKVMDIVDDHIDQSSEDEELEDEYSEDKIKLPLLIASSNDVHNQSEAADFLEQLTAAALSFGAYEKLVAEDVGVKEYVRTFVTNEQSAPKLFSPAPASLQLTPRHSMFPQVNERMRVIGALIGVCLNTLLSSNSLVLGAPLDRVVLQSLIDPDSEIKRSDAMESAVCAEALELAKQGISLQEARMLSPTHWPVLPERMEVADGIVDEWENYCVALVDKLLDSEQMTLMRNAFQATIHPEMDSHHFSPDLAYHMLVQRRPGHQEDAGLAVRTQIAV